MTEIHTQSGAANSGGQLYLVESCRTDIQANQLMDELFHDLEAYTTGQRSQRGLWGSNLLGSTRPGVSPGKQLSLKQTWGSFKEISSERFLIGLGIASLVIAGGVWLGGLNRAPVEAVNPAPNPADVEFARYLSQAMTRINQQPRPQANSNLNPNNGVAPTTIVTQDANGNRVERVYVPVSPNLVNAAAIPPTNPGPGTSANAAPVALTPVPPPPNSLAPRNTNASPTNAAPAPVRPTTPENNLVGVLELGNRSIALISIKGLMQRVEAGEIVPGSPWKLARIQGQMAILQRGNETKTVQVGEAF